VMLATVGSKPMVIVLLDSIGKYTRMGDAQRVKHWLETGESMPATEVRPLVVRSAPKLRKPAKAVKATPSKLVSSNKARNG